MNDTKLGKESVFGFDELFFSRTNKKGIIESGNSVFQRVSLFEWDELLGKPHRIVRHPSMPKGVFHLIWEEILSGEMVGGYVINRDKEGGYYWVFALMSPIEDGFLSVRLKPSSDIFEEIKKRYGELLSIEKQKEVTPEESHKILVEIIGRLGFSSYRRFMVEALMRELESRQEKIGQRPLPVLTLLRETLKSGTEIQERSEDIFKTYQKNVLVPLNLEIQAIRIGQEAASLATISSQYDSLAKEIQEEIKKFVIAGKVVQEKVQDCQFFVCNSILQREIYLVFEKETKPTPIQKEVEMGILKNLEEEQVKKAKDSLQAIQKELGEFRHVYESVRKLAIGLEMVSLSGRIESAKLSVSSSELMGLLNELAVFKDYLKETLKEINRTGNLLLDQAVKMGKNL